MLGRSVIVSKAFWLRFVHHCFDNGTAMHIKWPIIMPVATYFTQDTPHDLKGPCHDIFDLWLFSSNNPIWAPDSRVKAFSNMASKLFDKVDGTAMSMTPLCF
jgi:hypothetical protein